MLARKSSRKLVVADVAYRYTVSRWRRVSDWKPASAVLPGLVPDVDDYENRIQVVRVR
jgi:hypothetical protein